MPRHRVLVVDDDLLAAKVTRLMAEALGFDGIAAHDGAEALEAYRRYRPVAVLMDLQMPRMNGFDAIRGIRALERAGALPSCRIVMTTGRDTASTRLGAIVASDTPSDAANDQDE